MGDHKEVSNEGSLLADHNAYWTNLDEFVGDVVSFISLNTKTRIPLHSITPIGQLVIETAGQIRRWQVKLLIITMGITSMFWSVVVGFTIAILIAIFATGAFSSINQLLKIADDLDKNSE